MRRRRRGLRQTAAAESWPALAGLALGVLGAAASHVQESAGWPLLPRSAAASLPQDVVRSVLSRVPRQPLLVWASGSGNLRLASLDGEEPRQLKWAERENVTEAIRHVKFVPSGSFVVSASLPGGIGIWEAYTGRLLRTMRHDIEIDDLQVLPDDRRVATLGAGVIAIWDMIDGSVSRILDVGGGSQKDLLVLLSGAQIAMGATSCIGLPTPVFVFDTADGALRFRVDPDYPYSVVRIASSPCGTLLAAWESSGLIHIWNAPDWELVRTLLGVRATLRHSLAISSGGRRVAAGAPTERGGLLVLWDGATGALLAARSESWDEEYPHVAFLPGGDLLVVGWGDSVVLSDSSSGKQILDLARRPADVQNVRRVVVSPCGRFVAACGEKMWSNTTTTWLVVWEAASGRIVLRDGERTLASSCSVAIGPTGSMAELLAA